MRFITVLLLATISHSMQAQWTRVHPASPIHRYLHHAFAVPGSNRWIAIGNDIAESNNQGATWSITVANNLPVYLRPDLKYTDIVFTDEQNGFIVYEGSIYKTSDGGQQWSRPVSLSPLHAQYPYSAYFNAIDFSTENNGWAVGEFRKIFKTTNGGSDWEALTWSPVTAPYINYTDVQFINVATGFITGYEVSNIVMNFGLVEFVLKTVDGGETWERFDIPTGFDFKEINVNFIDSEHGYVHLTRTQSHNQIFYTSDGGKTWSERTPADLRNIHTLEWLPDGRGFAFGESHQYKHTFLRTENYGATWTPVPLPVFDQQDAHCITDITFTSDTDAFTVGASGNILTTTDGGLTWQLSNAGYPNFRSIDFTNANTGYATSGLGFFKTIDGGKHWEFQTKSDSLTIFDMKFESDARGMFYGWRNFYYTTTQGASAITQLELPMPFMSLSSFQQKGDSLFASGMVVSPRKNFLFISGDNGITWTTTQIPSITGLVNQMERHENHFYYSENVSIVRSSTQGTDFETISTFTNEHLNGIIVLDDGTLLASFLSGKVKRRAANTTTWIDAEGIENGEVVDFAAKGNFVFAYGYAVTNGFNYGAIWRSEDYGLHWQKENLPVIDNSISDMDIEEDKVWATGGFGQIYQLALTEVITANEYTLQNQSPVFYPIPTDDYLQIEFPDEKISKVQLIMTNGAMIPVEATPIGEFKWQLSLSNIPPGVYIARVETNRGWFRRRIVKR